MPTQSTDQTPLHQSIEPLPAGHTSAPADHSTLINESDREADRLAAALLPAALSEGARHGEAGPLLFTDLMAHELAGSHRVLMRFAGAAHALIGRDSSALENVNIAKMAAARDLAGARCAAGAGRVLDYTRQALLAWAARRPASPEEDRCIVVDFGDGTEEDVERCLKAAMAARAARQAAEGESAPVLDPSAQALLATAGRAAAELFDAAGVAPLAARATAPHGGLFMRRLFSDQLAALHTLKMRLDAGAVANLDRALALDLEPVAACRLAESAARQGDRFRRGLASLEKLDTGPSGRPGRTHTYWIASKQLPETEARNAMEASLSDLAPAARAGQGPRFHAEAGLRRGRLNNGNPSGDFLRSPRCGARARSGCACRQPAMANGRCRFHGGKSTGPRTADGLARSRAARLVHGGYSAEIIDLRKKAAFRVRRLRALLAIHNSRPPAGHGVDRHHLIATARPTVPALAIAGRDGYEPARNCNPHAGCAAGRGEIPAVAPVFRAPDRGREPMSAAA